MGFIVKNTTLCGISDLLCPHICRGCGELGSVLCDCCKNDIILEHENYCLNCQRIISGTKCPHCHFPPTFMVGWRDELIGKLIHDYKYNSVRALSAKLTEILDEILPNINGEVVIVPLPTIQKHIRERGLDHTYLLAKKLGKKRGWRVIKMLKRDKETVQVGTTGIAREIQAREAYICQHEANANTTYILLDDVWTTGASMRAAIKKLRAAGACKIMVAVLAVSRIEDK